MLSLEASTHFLENLFIQLSTTSRDYRGNLAHDVLPTNKYLKAIEKVFDED